MNSEFYILHFTKSESFFFRQSNNYIIHAEREANLQGHDPLVRLKNRHRHRIQLCRESLQSTRLLHLGLRRSQTPRPNPSRVYPSSNPWTRKGLIFYLFFSSRFSLGQRTREPGTKTLSLKWPEEQHTTYSNNFCRLVIKTSAFFYKNTYHFDKIDRIRLNLWRLKEYRPL